MNESVYVKNMFKCPICLKKCNEFYVDKYLQEIQKNYERKGKTIKEIKFNVDGSYEVNEIDYNVSDSYSDIQENVNKN